MPNRRRLSRRTARRTPSLRQSTFGNPSPKAEDEAAMSSAAAMRLMSLCSPSRWTRPAIDNFLSTRATLRCYESTPRPTARSEFAGNLSKAALPPQKVRMVFHRVIAREQADQHRVTGDSQFSPQACARLRRRRECICVKAVRNNDSLARSNSPAALRD